MSGSSSTPQWVLGIPWGPWLYAAYPPPHPTPFDQITIPRSPSGGSVPRTITVENFEWRYHLFQANIEGTAAGTLIPFPNREAALQAARDVNQFYSGADPEFLQAVEIMETTPTAAAAEVLFPKVVVGWSEWLDMLKEVMPCYAEEIGLFVYRQLYKSVRRRFENRDPSFLRLEDSFGIDDINRVLFLAAPTGRDFHSNIMQLSKMATEIVSVLQIVKNRVPDWNSTVLKPIDAAINLLRAFDFFIQSVYITWVQRNLPHRNAFTNESTRRWFALNHPVSYDLPETLRYFINLGRLGDRKEAWKLNLCKNYTFRYQMDKLIKNWRRSVAADPNLEKILSYSVSQARGGNQSSTTWKYKVEDIPLYVSNGMKHYWQNAGFGEKKMTKAEVINSLEDFIPGLSCKMYMGYAKAVIEGGYNHDLFDAVFILSKDT